MILLMKKTLKEEQVILFIEEADPTQERWYGRKVTVDEAKEISGIDNVMFLDSFEGAVDPVSYTHLAVPLSVSDVCEKMFTSLGVMARLFLFHLYFFKILSLDSHNTL